MKNIYFKEYIMNDLFCINFGFSLYKHFNKVRKSSTL